MGCKLSEIAIAPAINCRINRYIVGCKYILTGQINNAIYRINRYIVGCKCSSSKSRIFSALGINRYIVGCKLCKKVSYRHAEVELIDT